jgi:hypothetical protein
MRRRRQAVDDRRLRMAMGDAQIGLQHGERQFMGRPEGDPRRGRRQPIGQDRRRAGDIAPLQLADQLQEPGLGVPLSSMPARTKSGRQSGWLPVGSR